MKEHYVPFYIEGREAKALKNDIDTMAIAEDVSAGKGTIHELLHKAATAIATAAGADRSKRTWLEENEDEIKAAGGDKDEAWAHYRDGRIDELVYQLEPDVIQDLDDPQGEDDDEGDEDEDTDE